MFLLLSKIHFNYLFTFKTILKRLKVYYKSLMALMPSSGFSTYCFYFSFMTVQTTAGASMSHQSNRQPLHNLVPSWTDAYAEEIASIVTELMGPESIAAGMLRIRSFFFVHIIMIDSSSSIVLFPGSQGLSICFCSLLRIILANQGKIQ